MKIQASNMFTGVNVMSHFNKALLVSFAVALGACAGDVQDIDRTQPDKVKKSWLTGEWYFSPYVIEADANQEVIFEGLRGELERVRWEIRETELVAYRSWDLLMGGEDSNGDPEFNGAPVAVFPISSHFDVRREYNKATGEQSNIIEENTTDRPWYERDYIRVDWSSNLVGNPYRLESAVSAYSASGYYERGHEKDNPHRPEVNANHINIVGNYLMYMDQWYCYYFYNPTTCDGDHSAKLRLSFMRIEGDRRTEDGKNVLRDYQPLYYPDYEPIRLDDGSPVFSCYEDGSCLRDTLPVFERFGYFRSMRLAYDQEWGYTRDGRLFVGNRFNIWNRTHDARGEVIKPENRSTKKIVYYTNVRFPQDDESDWGEWQAGQQILTAWDASQAIAADWDLAFRKTVQGIKNTAVSDVGLPLPDVTLESIPQIFELRRNDCNPDNVAAYADKHGHNDALRKYGISSLNMANLERACAVLEAESDGDFTWQKMGDLRWNFFNWVDKPQAAGPLGIAAMAADPITGELISANANVFGAALDTYAAYAADVVQLMNGDLQLPDLMNGSNVREALRESWRRWDRQMSPERMQEMQDRHAQSRQQFFGGQVPEANRAFYDRQHYRGRSLSQEELDQARALPADTSKLRAIMGTPMERELLLNDDMKRALLGPLQYQPGQALTGDLAEFSPLDYFLGNDAALRKEAQTKLGASGIDFFEPDQFDDIGMANLAEELAGREWPDVFQHLRVQMYRSVMAHEVGHCLGLRHNFQGSFDPLNYNPEFWESYNPATGKVEKVSGGNPTRAERLMYSSIMDYDARFYADSLEGIGPYDVAAIKFGYGNLVEAFETRTAAAQYQSFLALFDYHDYPKMFAGTLSCQSSLGIDCNADFIAGVEAYNEYYDLDLQAQEALANGDMASWGDLRQQSNQAYEEFNRYFNSYFYEGLNGQTTEACTAANDYCGMWARQDVRFSDLQRNWTNYYMGRSYDLPDEVPYKFCPDEIAQWGSWVECLPYDKGGTYHEVTLDRMVRYDSYYFFRNFKRDRAEILFNDWYMGNYLYTLYDRFTGQMSNVYRNYLYSFSSLGEDKNGNFLSYTDFPFGRDWQAAGLEGLNFLNSILQQPEPGDYCLDSATNTYRKMAADAAPGSCTTDEMNIGLGVGKYYYTQWTDEYLYKATVLGSYWDKLAAILAITDNEGFFYRDYSSLFDVGAFQLSYWSGPLKKEMLNIAKGAIKGGEGDYVWRYDATAADPFYPAPVIDIYSPDDATSQAMYAKPKIEGASSYTLQWYAAVLPMARFNSGFDYAADFVNYSRICLEGYADCQLFTSDVAEYVDPLTGYKYLASRSDMPTEAIAPEILDQAQTFVDTVYTPKKLAFDAEPEGATKEQLRLELQAIEHQVADRTAFIEIIRDFSTYFGGSWR